VIDQPGTLPYYPTSMDNSKLDEMQQAYKQAVDQWIIAIRAEEALATSDYSEIAMERWDAAGFSEQDVQKKAKHARVLIQGRDLHFSSFQSATECCYSAG